MGGGEEKKRKSGIGKEGDGVWERGRRELEKREKKTEKEKDRDWKRGRRRGKKRETGIEKEGDGDWKRGRRRRTTCSLQSETGRDNLLTVLLCYQQKGSRY